MDRLDNLDWNELENQRIYLLQKKEKEKLRPPLLQEVSVKKENPINTIDNLVNQYCEYIFNRGIYKTYINNFVNYNVPITFEIQYLCGIYDKENNLEQKAWRYYTKRGEYATNCPSPQEFYNSLSIGEQNKLKATIDALKNHQEIVIYYVPLSEINKP